MQVFRTVLLLYLVASTLHRALESIPRLQKVQRLSLSKGSSSIFSVGTVVFHQFGYRVASSNTTTFLANDKAILHPLWIALLAFDRHRLRNVPFRISIWIWQVFQLQFRLRTASILR